MRVWDRQQYNRLLLFGAVKKSEQRNEYASGPTSEDLADEERIFNASILKHFYSSPSPLVWHT